MSGVNKVIVVGRLGLDPEVKELGEGRYVCNMSVATSEKYKDKAGEQVEATEWHRIAVFGKLAEICGKFLAKGREVYIEGKLKTRSWEDDQGQKRYATDIVANNVQFLGSMNAEKKEDEPYHTYDESPAAVAEPTGPRVNHAPSADDIGF